ncbi:hypothetical protein K438DRAFT_1950140 [Mycena galopus ATCC 62051]|nr:hypothetical protein K438DRAFT_1950140 [Mycena galopus ATCC 62051]
MNGNWSKVKGFSRISPSNPRNNSSALLQLVSGGHLPNVYMFTSNSNLYAQVPRAFSIPHGSELPETWRKIALPPGFNNTQVDRQKARGMTQERLESKEGAGQAARVACYKKKMQPLVKVEGPEKNKITVAAFYELLFKNNQHYPLLNGQFPRFGGWTYVPLQCRVLRDACTRCPAFLLSWRVGCVSAGQGIEGVDDKGQPVLAYLHRFHDDAERPRPTAHDSSPSSLRYFAPAHRLYSLVTRRPMRTFG